MPDMTAISGLLSSLKVSTDLTKSMLGIRDAQLVREKAVELTAEIMSAQASAMTAQAAQSELADRVRDLEKKIVELENWNREKQRYGLTEIATGVFAYAVKLEEQGSEPAHHICAGCYQNGRKSVLQKEMRNPGRNALLICHACKAELITAGSRGIEPYSGPRSRAR